MHELHRYVEGLIAGARRQPSGWWAIDCPMCVRRGEPRPDRRRRGGVLFEDDGSVIYHCFRCGFALRWAPDGRCGARVRELVEALGGDPEEAAAVAMRARLAGRPADGIGDADAPAPPPTFRPPDAWRPLPELVEAGWSGRLFGATLDALVARTEVRRRHWRRLLYDTDERPATAGCVLALVGDGRRITGWVGRRFVGRGPRWFGRRPGDALFAADRLDRRTGLRWLPVVEGVFDALAIGGVAILGRRPTAVQQARLLAAGPRMLFVPDRDPAGLRDAPKLASAGFWVSIPRAEDEPWPGPWPAGAKDVADAVRRTGCAAWVLHRLLREATRDPRAVAARVAILRGKGMR